MDKKRVLYFDYLRVIACFLVIIIHTVANYEERLVRSSFTYYAGDLMKTIGFSGVAIFFAISGAIFLSPEISGEGVNIKKLWTRNILRLVLSYVIWSWFYTATVWWGKFPMNPETVSLFFREFLYGTPMYHLWFIPALVSIYIIVPVLKPGFKEQSVAKYFAVAAFVVQILLHDIYKYDYFWEAGFDAVYHRFPLIMLTSNLVYFVLGLYLYRQDYSGKQRIVIYSFAALLLIITKAVDYSRDAIGRATELNSLTVYFTTFALFVLFKYMPIRETKFRKFIAGLSKLTFGIYLLHPKVLDTIGIPVAMKLPIPYIVRLPMTAVITFAVCAAIIFVLSKIPVINKYLI